VSVQQSEARPSLPGSSELSAESLPTNLLLMHSAWASPGWSLLTQLMFPLSSSAKSKGRRSLCLSYSVLRQEEHRCHPRRDRGRQDRAHRRRGRLRPRRSEKAPPTNAVVRCLSRVDSGWATSLVHAGPLPRSARDGYSGDHVTRFAGPVARLVHPDVYAQLVFCRWRYHQKALGRR
jgi:hypothetical protein